MFNDEGQLILNQNNGKQAAILNCIIALRQSYSSLGLLRRDSLVWLKLVKDVARTVKDMPVRYLQNINGQNFEFLYQLDRCGKQLILLPQVMFCLRQFSEIIEELCQKRWIDYIRKNSTNAPILNQLPNLEQFMFEPSRNQLNAVANVLVELQDCKCFYCNKPMRNGNYAARSILFLGQCIPQTQGTISYWQIQAVTLRKAICLHQMSFCISGKIEMKITI